MNIKEAIDSRRIHHQLYPNNLEIESGFPKVMNLKNIKSFKKTLILKEIEIGIIKRGHKKKCFNFGGSVIQGIQIVDKNKSNKFINAYSDPRKGEI